MLLYVGEIFEASENFEHFYQLCKDHADWELDGGKPMHPEACNNLSRIYTKIAEVFDEEEDGDMDQQLAYLKKACDTAKEGELIQWSTQWGERSRISSTLQTKQRTDEVEQIPGAQMGLHVCLARADTDLGNHVVTNQRPWALVYC